MTFLGKGGGARLLAFLALLQKSQIGSFQFSSQIARDSQQRRQGRRYRPLLFVEDNNDNSNEDHELDHDNENSQRNPTKQNASLNRAILNRFAAPAIDDPALPMSDCLVAQVVAPSIQIAWLSLNRAPAPSWLKPIFDTNVLYAKQGSLIAPALIHGAALASCWVVGALAARAYQRDAISPQLRLDGSSWDYSKVLVRVVQAGAFATGVLIMSTQLDLFLEFQGRWVQPGDSPESDFRLTVAAVELINDVFFEAVCLTTWRLYLASQSTR